MPSFEVVIPTMPSLPWGKAAGQHLPNLRCARVVLDDGHMFESLIELGIIESKDNMAIATAVNVAYRASGLKGIPDAYLAAPAATPTPPPAPVAKAADA